MSVDRKVTFSFQNQYMDSTIGSKMTLVNIVPQVVLHLKMHAFLSVGFFGEWIKVPAPCALVHQVNHLDVMHSDLPIS